MNSFLKIAKIANNKVILASYIPIFYYLCRKIKKTGLRC